MSVAKPSPDSAEPIKFCCGSSDTSNLQKKFAGISGMNFDPF